MHLRRKLLFNSWLQLLLVFVVVILTNTWSARHFSRLDLTGDRLYTLDLATRSLVYRLERPLVAKVYFTRGLEAPYNNHEQILVDMLEELRAYSHGFMDIQVTDPTGIRDLQDEAMRFGITPIQYRYRSASHSELKRVFMGVALVYGDKQQVLSAVTQTQTLEYDLAKAIKALISDEEPRIIGFSTGHGEPDLANATGPMKTLRDRLSDKYSLAVVPVGGAQAIPEEVDALFVLGPQRSFDTRSQYHLDQFLMRGGALAVFLSNTKADMRALRPQSVYHGLEALLGHYGVQVNRDLVVDRKQNGVMRFPVRQGRYVVQMPINYALIPKATELDEASVIVKDLDTMLFPFVSSLTLADPMPPEVSARVLASSSDASGRIKGVRSISPNSFQVTSPGEELGSWPLLVSLVGEWRSYFAEREIPKPPAETPFGDAVVESEDPSTKLRQSIPTRLVVSGSADFVANNIPFMLNLTDWMAQDEALIGIRSKIIQVPVIEPLEADELRNWKMLNLFVGPALLLVLGVLRWSIRRRTAGMSRQTPGPPGTLGDSATSGAT